MRGGKALPIKNIVDEALAMGDGHGPHSSGQTPGLNRGWLAGRARRAPP
jgi:hypothetical protein